MTSGPKLNLASSSFEIMRRELHPLLFGQIGCADCSRVPYYICLGDKKPLCVRRKALYLLVESRRSSDSSVSTSVNLCLLLLVLCALDRPVSSETLINALARPLSIQSVMNALARPLSTESNFLERESKFWCHQKIFPWQELFLERMDRHNEGISG